MSCVLLMLIAMIIKDAYGSTYLSNVIDVAFNPYMLGFALRAESCNITQVCHVFTLGMLLIVLSTLPGMLCIKGREVLKVISAEGHTSNAIMR